MAKEKWDHFKLKLPATHGWKAQPGNVVIVLERGLLSFECPQSWHLVPGKTTTLYDAKPPDDEARLQVSLFPLRPDVDWSEFPFTTMGKELFARRDEDDDEEDEIWREPTKAEVRNGIPMDTSYSRWFDKEQKREAFSRQVLARHELVLALMTLDFWVEDAERIEPVWWLILDTMRLGDYIENPFMGPGSKA
jgi:hypothetical protein